MLESHNQGAPGADRRGEIVHRLALAAALLLGCFLRLYDLGGKSLWRDEIETMLFSLPNLGEIVRRALEIPYIPIPPFYFILTHFFLAIGESSFFLRLPAALSSIAAMLLLYVLGRRWFGRGTALMAVFLLAVSPFQIYYAQEGRSYAFLMFLSLVSLLLMEKAADRGLIWLAPWGVVTMAILYTHHFGALIVGSAGLVGLVFFFSGEGFRGISARRFFSAYALTAAVLLVLWFPMLQHLIAGITGPRGVEGVSLQPGFSLEEFSTLVGLMGLGTRHGALLLPLLAVIGFLPFLRRERRGLLIALAWLVPTLLVLLTAQFSHVFRVRYLIYLIPIYLLMAARGSRTLDGILGRQLGRFGWWRRGFPVVTALLVVAAFVWIQPYYATYWREEKQNWKAAAAFLEEVAGGDDLVMVAGKGDDTNLHRYILDHYSNHRFKTIIIHGDEPSRKRLVRALKTRPRIWYVTTQPLNADFQHRRSLVNIYTEELSKAGYTPLAPIHFSTGTSLTSMESEFLALSRYKPAKVIPLVPEQLSPGEVAGRSLDLLEKAGKVPRGFVDPRPTQEYLRGEGGDIHDAWKHTLEKID